MSHLSSETKVELELKGEADVREFNCSSEYADGLHIQDGFLIVPEEKEGVVTWHYFNVNRVWDFRIVRKIVD